MASLAAVSIACSFRSLDDLKENAGRDGGSGAQADATPSCITGGDCSGCTKCSDWCACHVIPAYVDQCVSGCSDSGSGGSSNGAGLVACAGQSCSVSSSQACCQLASGSDQWTCHSLAADCAGTEVSCDGPEDCPQNQVCCARRNGGGGYDALLCSADCLSPDSVVCNDSSSSSCPLATVCKASSLPYLLCQ